jgi:cytochrome c553
MKPAFLIFLALMGPLSACRGQVTEGAPIVVERNMYDQEKYNPQAYSPFFADHGAMRPPVVGAVPQDRFEEDESVATGVLSDATGYVMTIPEVVVARSRGGMGPMVQRGRERFDIYCATCHGRTGDGASLVARAGFPKLPKLDDARVCTMPDGQLYATIANGVRNMPPYAAQLDVDDRWAVVAYVRALELNQISQGGSPR